MPLLEHTADPVQMKDTVAALFYFGVGLALGAWGAWGVMLVREDR